jgi:hypothetical protein
MAHEYFADLRAELGEDQGLSAAGLEEDMVAAAVAEDAAAAVAAVADAAEAAGGDRGGAGAAVGMVVDEGGQGGGDKRSLGSAVVTAVAAAGDSGMEVDEGAEGDLNGQGRPGDGLVSPLAKRARQHSLSGGGGQRAHPQVQELCPQTSFCSGMGG